MGKGGAGKGGAGRGAGGKVVEGRGRAWVLGSLGRAGRGLCAGAGRGERAEQRRRRAGALLLAG